MIDTPGDPNFIVDAKVCMTVVDGFIMVLGANSGVEVKTKELWDLANQIKVPRLVYVSKMDMRGPISMLSWGRWKGAFPLSASFRLSSPLARGEVLGGL